MPSAEIINVGYELLTGQTVNTNGTWLGEKLNRLGCEVQRIVAVGDDEDLIRREVERALGEAEILVITGGLGPTHDDVTKKSIAEVFGVGFRFDEAVLAGVAERFARRGRPMPESNRMQAMVPEGFEVLNNPVGTAPGLFCERVHEGRSRMVFVLPGVPHEMRLLTEIHIEPRIVQAAGRRFILHRTLGTTGAGESHVAQMVGDLSDWLRRDLRLAYLPSPGGVSLRITAAGDDLSAVEKRINQFEQFLRGRLGDLVYGADGEGLESVVGRMLEERGLTMALAESCTAGHTSNRVTDVPGSSAYFKGGVIAYDNEVKISELGVDARTLEEVGAVSEAVAIQMAEGVRRALGTDVGLSTTGIAGPGGATEGKPVGTVWIGYSDAGHSAARRLHLVEDRLLNKEMTTAAVLDFLRKKLIGQGKSAPAAL